jgi:hypothetical protein
MIRFILVLLTGLVTSFFLFPFNLPINIIINTKMILAVIGAGLYFLDIVKGRKLVISRDFLVISILCAIISIWAYFVSVSNGTPDVSYARYIVSVMVWLAAAYAVVWMIRATHGTVTVENICHYLIGVCSFQCILAYVMSVSPSLELFIDSLMGEGEAFMSATESRLHGLGAALDPSGLRFSAVLVIISVLLSRVDFDKKQWLAFLYLLAYAIITVFGNMIARSTTIGALVAILLFIALRLPYDGNLVFDRSWAIIGGSLLVAVLLSVWLYNNDVNFRSNLRFGFEGFFSLAEKGRWEVRSNEILKGMVVWPETVKTWLVGDGYFENPGLPNRLGQITEGYYMKTDIGYLRFIFYFGVVGLIGMILVFMYMTYTCIKSFPRFKWMFLAVLLVNYIGWLKVSSDVIMVFAPFLVLAFITDKEQ